MVVAEAVAMAIVDSYNKASNSSLIASSTNKAEPNAKHDMTQ